MHNKIIIVGNFNLNVYEKILMEGFLGLELNIAKYIIEYQSLWNKIINFKKLKKINNRFIYDLIQHKPDVLFLYRVNEIFPSSILKIQKALPNMKLIIYHNDNPFISLKNRLKYWLFLKCLKLADLVYVYRFSNIEDTKKYGARKVKVLMPYYYSKDTQRNKIEINNKKLDVTFIGYYEKIRGEYIDELIKNNVKVKVFGGQKWSLIAKKYNWPNGTIQEPVYGREYMDILANSKIALCFLSRKNNDVYTRRNFEIPAAYTLQVSEFSKELTKLFKPNEEIILFKNKHELIEKIKNLLGDTKTLLRLTYGGYRRVIDGNNTERDRAKQIMADIKLLE